MYGPCSGLRLRCGAAHAQYVPPGCDRRVDEAVVREQVSKGFFVLVSFLLACNINPLAICRWALSDAATF